MKITLIILLAVMLLLKIDTAYRNSTKAKIKAELLHRLKKLESFEHISDRAFTIIMWSWAVIYSLVLLATIIAIL